MPSLQSALYTGRTLHTRLKPSFNSFSYSIFMAYVDLSELESGALDCWPIFSSRTAFALASLLPRDHLVAASRADAPPQQPLSERLRDAVEKDTGRRPDGPLALLAGLRILGLEFNPVSFFYILKQDDTPSDTQPDQTSTAKPRRIDTFVAEVNNIPWFEQHLYILSPKHETADPPPPPTPPTTAATAQADPPPCPSFRAFTGHAKAFHVSPFIPVSHVAYDWLVTDPGAARLGVRIGLSSPDARFFSASVDLRRRPFSPAQLLALLLTFPLMALKVVAAIMFEASKLWWRGFTFYPHPHGKETPSSRAIARAVAAVVSARRAVAAGVAWVTRGKVAME